MISVIIVLFLSGLTNGIVYWYDLPGFYLNASVPNLTTREALRYAAFYDPEFPPGFNYLTAVARCETTARTTMGRLNLTQREVIACYTASSPISPRVNAVLQYLDEVSLGAWAPFLKLFHNAVNNAEDTNGNVVELCRGDPFNYGSHPIGAVVRLPLSYSILPTVCKDFAQEPWLGTVINECTITKILTNTTLIDRYSTLPGEQESPILPGRLAKVLSITPQQTTTCRLVTLYEIDARLVPRTANVRHLKNGDLAVQAKQPDDVFLRVYYSPSFIVPVAKIEPIRISTRGGRDDPYNVWPFITNVTSAKTRLSIGQVLLAVDGNSTRGLLQQEVGDLINSSIKSPIPYINFTVATR